MHDSLAYLLTGALAVWGIATAPFERWAYRADVHSQRKLLGYAVTIVCSWALTAIAVSIYGWDRLLVAPAALSAMVAVLLIPLVVAFFVLALFPLLQSLRGESRRLAYEAAIRREFTEIPGFVPNDPLDRVVWTVLSLTAGVCEETLFRGFLIRFLSDVSVGLPVVGALVASSLLFGLGHGYQGLKAIRNSTVGGLAFGCLFLLSGSLVVCIAIHSLIDLQMLYVVRFKNTQRSRKMI